MAAPGLSARAPLQPAYTISSNVFICVCSGSVRRHQGAGPNGADRLCRHSLLSPFSSHPASFWRQVCGPHPCGWLLHQLTLPGAACRDTRPGWLRTAPSTPRAWPVVLEVGPGRTSWRAAEPRQLSKLGHSPAAPELRNFRVRKGLHNLWSGLPHAAPVSPDEASKALMTRVTGPVPIGEHASIFLTGTVLNPGP